MIVFDLDFTVNDQPMGSELAATSDRQIDIKVESPDSIKMIELVRNGQVIERHFPEDTRRASAPLPGRVKCRLRYGWGPWGALDLGRICDWEMSIRIAGGRFVNALPCFQSAPFDEQRRDRLRVVDPQALHLSRTRLACRPTARIPRRPSSWRSRPTGRMPSSTVAIDRPAKLTKVTKLQDLQHDNTIEFTGEFTSESFMLERLVGPSQSSATLRWQDRRPGRTVADWYYVRVQQHNNQMAWSSPVWVG